MSATPDASFDPTKFTRPHPVLLNYYIVATAVATLFVIPITIIALLPNLFKYRTLRYRFDGEGVSMAWGVLFRREINLTYRRIQDIHVTRNLFQRWMGLATVAIQTASGSATPEMSIEGILEVDQLRDFLYSKMRGARGESEVEAGSEDPGDEALRLLREIRDGLVGLRSTAGTDPTGRES